MKLFNFKSERSHLISTSVGPREPCIASIYLMCDELVATTTLVALPSVMGSLVASREGVGVGVMEKGVVPISPGKRLCWGEKGCQNYTKI